jgi:hypothetical protein
MDNEFWVKFLIFWAWCEEAEATLQQLREFFSCAGNADDISWTQKDPQDPRFNPEKFAWIVRRDFGVTITSTNWEMVDWHQLSILSFHLEWDPHYSMFFHAPETERILCSLQWPKGDIAQFPVKTLNRLNNIRVATWGNQYLRKVVEQLFWAYAREHNSDRKNDPAWRKAVESFHPDQILGWLYSGEEHGFYRPPPVEQSAQGERKYPPFLHLLDDTFTCQYCEREWPVDEAAASHTCTRCFVSHRCTRCYVLRKPVEVTLRPSPALCWECVHNTTHCIECSVSLTDIEVSNKSRVCQWCLDSERFFRDKPPCSRCDFYYCDCLDRHSNSRNEGGEVDLTDNAEWHAMWDAMEERDEREMLRQNTREFTFWGSVTCIMLLLLFLLPAVTALEAGSLTHCAMSEKWSELFLQNNSITFSSVSCMPKTTPGRVIAEIAHSALTKPIEGLLDIFSESLSDEFAKAVQLPKMGKSKKKSSRKGSKKKPSKKASKKKTSRKASVKRAATALAAASKLIKKRKHKGPKSGGRPAGTRARKGFSMDYACFKGKDYVTTLQFSNVDGKSQQILEGPGQVIYKDQIRPWLMVQNGRLARCMALFEKWRPKSLKFRFRSTMPRGTNAGTVLVVYDPKVDPDEFPEVTLGEDVPDRNTLSRFEAHTNAKILEVDPVKGKRGLNEFAVNVSLNTGPFGGWFYFDRYGESETLFNQSFGQIMVMVQGPMNCLGSSGEYPDAADKPLIDWADLIMEYEIECSVAAETDETVESSIFSVQGNWDSSNAESYTAWADNLTEDQNFPFLEKFTNPFFGLFPGPVDELSTRIIGDSGSYPTIQLKARNKQGLIALFMVTPVHADMGTGGVGWATPDCHTFAGGIVSGYAQTLEAVKTYNYLPTILFLCPGDAAATYYILAPGAYSHGTGGVAEPSAAVYYDFFAFEIPPSWNLARKKLNPEVLKDPKVMQALLQLLQERGVKIPALTDAEPKRLKGPKKQRESKREPKEYVIVVAPDSADEKKQGRLCSDCLEDRACTREPPCPMATLPTPAVKPALKRVTHADVPKTKPTRSSSNKT